jgi:hypothetical protein
MGLTFRLGQVPLAIFTDSSNNVGIGAAANASFKLQVTGATNLTGALSGTSAAFSGNGLFGGSTNAGNAGTFTLSVGVPGTTAGGLQLWAATNQSSFLQFGDGTSAADNYRGYVGYNHATDALTLGSAGADKLTIASTGAATFSSSAAINAIFNSTDANGGYLAFRRSGTDIGYLGNSAQLGIGVLNALEMRASNDLILSTTSGLLRITSGGNVGIGTTPNSWASGTTALQIGTTGTLWNRASDGLFVLGSNSFFNGSADIQITTGTSNRIYFLNGGITFDRAVSTAAGSNTPWQTSMTITSGGCVAINNPSDKSQPLSVQGFIDNWTAFLQANTATSQSFGPLIYGGSNSNDWCIYAASAGGTPYFRVRGDGATFVAGSLSKGSGSFRIDHPLESMSETHELVHSFIEGPQADLIYRGKLTLVNGKAQANIDEVSTMTNGTFEALCREVQCFTTNESGWDLVKGKVIGNIIYIESQNVNSTDEISWMVIGERKDKHMIDTGWTDENGKVIVEPLKIDEPENLPNNNKQ